VVTEKRFATASKLKLKPQVHQAPQRKSR